MSEALTPTLRKALKARAHALEPVVMIGSGGLTPAVVREVDRALTAHELIKVRAGGDDRFARKDLMKEICEQTGASPVQHIGKVLVLWRKRPEQE